MRLFSVLVALAASLLFAACGKNDSARTGASGSAQNQKIVVGLDDSFPPMGFRDEQHNIVGFDIDMAREAFKRMGCAVEFKPIDWNSKEAELSSKRIDVIWNGLTILEERKEKIAFTDPYMENHQVIVVSSKSPIRTKDALAGKVIGIQEGSSAIDAVKRDTKAFESFSEMKTYADNVTALMDLEIGRLDAVVVDEVVGRYYVAKKPENYVILWEHFGTEEYGIGVRKDDTDLLERLQNVLNEMKRDGTAVHISRAWFGGNVIK
ncbi:amino acid ABC transporter substrate-binding protein [Ereboglobus luteus]|uniref:amino acid ABC transporter substrate-binding protein n=1 Tax=Ereboglobus luteus TaxID=1796921 RepID=UPI003CCD72CF